MDEAEHTIISLFRKWLYFTLVGWKAKLNNFLRYLFRMGREKRWEETRWLESESTVTAAEPGR